ncbi:MAG: hypothetical protein Q8P20_09445 [bacterium]|nr:hypothetical protein [bacterium]
MCIICNEAGKLNLTEMVLCFNEISPWQENDSANNISEEHAIKVIAMIIQEAKREQEVEKNEIDFYI